jgi:hypothetical protein
MMNSVERPIHLAASTLNKHRHICALFYTPDEKYRVLLPFIREGIERGEKAFHVVDPKLLDDHRNRLQSAGIDTEAEERDGLLEVHPWQNAYLQEGFFDQNRMLALVEKVLRAGTDQGFPMTRVVAGAEWALEALPGVNDLVEYETRLNHVLSRYKDVVVCTYDCRKFNAGQVMDIVRTHPMVIIGGLLQENPFFVPPDEFLVELRDRGAYRARAAS